MTTELPMLDGSVRGCCPLDCQDTCSWLAHVVDGRVVRLEGSKDHPYTRGALCAKVNDYQERTYAPDRLLYPLGRVGAKGSGQFERISWDEAMGRIAGRFREIIDTYGPEAIYPVNYLGSMGIVQRRALMRVFHALGTSGYSGSVCGAAGNAIEAEGHLRGFDPELLSEAQFVLLWGSNPVSTAHHSWHFLQQARQRNGARIVAIDPIRTRSAKAADEHISIRPGMDAVLAAGIGRVLITEGLIDRAAVAAVATDFADYERSVQAWTPALVEAATDVPAETVVRIAREFAAARPAVIRSGVGVQQSANGESVVRAQSALAILGGHWGLPGGGLFIETSPDLDESAASRPDLQSTPSRKLDLARIGEHLVSDSLSPPVKALVVWGMNPAVTQPDASVVQRGLAREDLFTVVLEHFMTDTARFADVILPSTTQLEHFDIVGSWGHHYISANTPAIAPLGESLSHGEIARRLARSLGLTNPALFETDEAIAASALPEGLTLETVQQRGWVKRSLPRPDYDDGRTVRIAGPIVAPPRREAGVLQLLTPKSHYFLNTTFANMPRQRKAMQRPTLDMHPTDAQERDLADGDAVSVSTDSQELRVWLRVNDDLHPGVVSLPGKWWGTPQATSAVANLLSPSSYAPHGQPAYNDTYVRVQRASDDD